MSWSHVAWASKQTAGGGINKLVLLTIADATSHDSPMLVVKLDRLAERCELNEKTIRNALKDLEARGLIGTVLRFFEGHRISSGYFLMGENWAESAKQRMSAENERNGYSCRLRCHDGLGGEPGIGNPPMERGTGIDRADIPDEAVPRSEQLLPSSYLPSSYNTEFPAGMSPDEQQSESASVISITSTSQTLAQAPDQPLSSRAMPPPPSSAGPLPRQKRGPVIPPLDEFVTWAEKNHPGWEREAAEWHKRLASQDWINGAGKPILNAKSTFNTWMSNGWIKRLPQSQSAKRFLSPAEMQAQEEAAAQNYIPGFRS